MVLEELEPFDVVELVEKEPRSEQRKSDPKISLIHAGIFSADDGYTSPRYDWHVS